MYHYFICLLVLGTSLLLVAEGCGRVPATPPPTTSPAPTEPTINGSSRSLQCTGEETNRTACLNGGTCFVLVIGEDRNPACHCTSSYEGVRCEELNFDIIFTSRDSALAKAGIAASIVVLLIIVLVFTAVAIVYIRRRKEEQRERQKNVERGLLPENYIVDHTEAMELITTDPLHPTSLEPAEA